MGKWTPRIQPSFRLYEDIFAVVLVGVRELNLPVETARSSKSNIEVLWSIGRSNDNYVGFRGETIHESKQLSDYALRGLM